MDSDLLSSGVMLMLVGMGTVFLFLTLLVVATTAMSHAVARLEPDMPGTADDSEIAAISAAILRHRDTRNTHSR